MARSKNFERAFNRRGLLFAILVIAIFGVVFIGVSRADSPYVAAEAEDGTRNSNALLTVDSTASGGSAVGFGQAGTNILAGKLFTSNVGNSSNEAGPINNLTDGDENSRWISVAQRPVDLTVDMQGVYTLNKIRIVWAADTIKNYTLAVSNDGTAWTAIYSGQTNNTTKQAVDYTSFSATAKGRYLRISGSDAWNAGYGNSIWEVAAYGTLDASQPVGNISNFTATAASSSSASLAWSYTGGTLSGFTIKRDGITIASPVASARSYTDSGLINNKSYTYTISATYQAGGSTNTMTATLNLGSVLYTGGILSIAFDDGSIGQYNNALPSLNSRGFKGTFFLISNLLNSSGYINPAQAKAMAAQGHEIGSHSKSHPSDMTSYSYAQVDAEYGGAQDAFQAALGFKPKTCGYPYGAYNATIDSVVRKYFHGCRSSLYDQIFPSTAQLYNLPNYAMGPTSTTATVKQLVDRSVAQKSWTIITFHQVGTSGDLNVSSATFNAMMDTIKASGIKIMTVDQALTAIGK